MKSKLLIYFIPVLFVMFLFYGYSTTDNPIKDLVTSKNATNTIEQYNSTIGTVPLDASSAVLYSQQELVTNPGGGFGGANASAITDPGTTFGFGNQQLNGNRMGDDFTIPAGQTWIIDSIIVFHYQTGSTTTSTINNVNLQIWNGATPGTGTIVAGDSTTNRLVSSYFSNIYRVSATTLTNNQRPIMRTSVNMNGASLPAGTYWIDYAAGGTLASGPWNPPRTIVGQPATGNAYQRLGTTFTWAPALDGTNPQGAPFVVYGTISAPAGGTITVSRNGIYKSIPENGGNTNPMIDTLTVSGIPSGNVIRKISVKIDTVLHTYIGDLRFWLTHNTAVDTIISRVGNNNNVCDNFIGTNLVDSVGLINIQNIPSACVGGQSQATGSFNPKSPLSVFNNTGDPNGLYILRISDNANIDTGSLRAWSVTIDYGTPSGISSNTSLASEYNLSQNYPNPFNPSTKIDFSIPKSGLVTIKVFDIIGKEVATLINEYRNAGNHEITFNGSSLSSGIYFYRIETGNFIATKKMSLLK